MNRIVSIVLLAGALSIGAAVSCKHQTRSSDRSSDEFGKSQAAAQPHRVVMIVLPRYQANLPDGPGRETFAVACLSCHSARYITTWFRHAFVVDDIAPIDHLIFRLRRDDGAVVYLNGTEVYRENMPAGPVQPSTTAVADIGSTEEATFFKRIVLPTGLHSGTNLLAVEIHQFATNSTDLSFNLELDGLTESPQALLPRLTAQRSGSNVLLSWPAAYSGWSLYTEPTLSRAWTKSFAPLLLSNDLNTVSQSPSNSAAFFQLHKTTFCSPFE